MAGHEDNTRDGARTSAQVAGMSADARSELARNLARASSEVSIGSYRRDQPVRRDPVPRDRSGGRPVEREGDAAEPAAVARLASSLQRTERRLKVGGGVLTEGRKVRLSSRATRLKRQLRKIK
jgi:hypothetical protein